MSRWILSIYTKVWWQYSWPLKSESPHSPVTFLYLNLTSPSAISPVSLPWNHGIMLSSDVESFKSNVINESLLPTRTAGTCANPCLPWLRRKQKISLSYLTVPSQLTPNRYSLPVWWVCKCMCVSVYVCIWECLHKRGSAGFLGSGNIQYVNIASGSTSWIKKGGIHWEVEQERW